MDATLAAVSEEAAITSLFRAALDEFVAVRKQLSSELKAAGDAEAAGRVAKLKRPTVSVWTVNQLWWQDREAFEALFASARRISAGDLSASAEHRRALAELREAARRVLTEAGHPASEATLRRILTTLTSLAALGGFDPDRPGTLQRDRDPPGFEALTLPLASAEAGPSPAAQTPDATPARSAAEAAAEREAAARAAATKKAEAEHAQRVAAERKRVETELTEARRRLERRRALVDDLAERLKAAESELESSRADVAQLEQSLAALRQAEPLE